MEVLQVMPNQNSDCIRYYDYDGNGEQSLPENAVINLLNDKKKFPSLK